LRRIYAKAALKPGGLEGRSSSIR